MEGAELQRILDEKGAEVEHLRAQKAACEDYCETLEREIQFLKGVIQQMRSEEMDEVQ